MNKIIITMFIFANIGCAALGKKKIEPQQAENVPRLKRPQVRRVWVPDQIIGDEYITGHWKFLIEKNAVWTKEN